MDDKGSVLNNRDIQLYSRQLLLPQFGLECQKRLKSGRVLIVGLGGLGAPASLYLAGAGVGTLGLVDRPDDVVEESNLHRQILYTSVDANTKSKVTLAGLHLRAHNPQIDVVLHDAEPLTAKNAITLVDLYDVVLDCTDNVLSRYLLGDACAITRTPLVSGAAIGLSGQLCVLSSTSDTPCYRCLFPQPPPPHCVGSCDVAGVLGPVPGIIGTLQALEALKIIANFQSAKPLQGVLLLFDATNSSFRSVKMRPRVSTCPACGDNPSIDMETYDYDGFVNGAGMKSNAFKIPDINPIHRVSVEAFANIRSRFINSKPLIYSLIDVRPSQEFAICHLPEAENHPLSSLYSESAIAELVNYINSDQTSRKTFLICRRGNASKHALNKLLDAGAVNVFDVVGGLEEWHHKVDEKFPLY